MLTFSLPTWFHSISEIQSHFHPKEWYGLAHLNFSHSAKWAMVKIDFNFSSVPNGLEVAKEIDFHINKFSIVFSLKWNKPHEKIRILAWVIHIWSSAVSLGEAFAPKFRHCLASNATVGRCVVRIGRNLVIWWKTLQGTLVHNFSQIGSWSIENGASEIRVVTFFGPQCR